MLKGFAEASEKRPRLTIALVGLITIFMTYGATQVTMSSEIGGFLPQDYTSVKVTNELENAIGSFVNEMILVEGENLTTADAFRTLVELDLKLDDNPDFQDYIIQVKSYPDYVLNAIKNYDNLTDAELEALVHQLLSQPEIASRASSLLSDDRDAALLSISVNSRLSIDELFDKTKALHRYTKSFDENHPSLQMSNTGSLSIESEMRETMNHDNGVLIPIAIIVVILVLFMTFKRLSDTGLLFLSLGLGAVWMIGAMGLAGMPFMTVHVALVPIILGVGIDYTIHMLNRYYEERGKKLNARKSAMRSVKTVGVAIFLTTITTMIGFGSFGVSDMPPLRDFGFLAASGVLFIFILSTTLLPSLLTVRDQRKDRKRKVKRARRKDRIGKILSKVGLSVQQYRMPILISAGVITAICIIPAAGLTTTMSPEMFLPEDAKSVNTMQKVEHYFGGQDIAHVLVKGDYTWPKNVYSIYNLENSVLSDPQNPQGKLITKSESIASFILKNLPDMENQNQIREAIKNLRERYPTQINSLIIGENKSVIYFYIQGETDKDMAKASEIIRSHAKDYSSPSLSMMINTEPAVGGRPVIISDIMDDILPSMRNSIILAILLVGAILILVFRSVLLGLISTIPVLLALLWEFGLLGGLGWSLDVMNMAISALAIGIGADFTIHVVHRFQEEWKKNGKSPKKSISMTMQSVGRAITAAAATTIGVFLVLSLSGMPLITRFGQLAATTIFFTLVGALIILPPALLAYAKWKKK